VRANEQRQPLRSALADWYILLVIATALSACRDNLGPRAHEQQTLLDLPNFQRLTAYSQLAPSASSELIDSLITYIEPERPGGHGN
jgi:hypothetical protein